MALHVTQCPRCESTFNTSARLLEAAHGLVRCGACLSIFEADQHFVDTMAAASNDGSDGESVFISAPGDYVDPTRFLQQENEGAAPAGTADSQDEDLLYAKSDAQDSHFDVFDVDPQEHDSPVTEQVLDSDFDVFDVEEFEAAEAAAEQDVQDHEFDIYDAGEREIRRPPFMLADAGTDQADGEHGNPRKTERNCGAGTGALHSDDDAQIQIRVSFSFDPAGSQVNFTSHPLPDNLLSGMEHPAAKEQRSGSGPRSDRNPSELTDRVALDPAVEPPTLSEVILPVGPDARTMLEALKKANEQSRKEQQDEDRKSESAIDQEYAEQADSDEAEFLYDDIELEPVDGKFLDAETVQPAQEGAAVCDTDGETDSETDADTVERSTASSEWEDIEVNLDESSFVILPEDPYQPSAFVIDEKEVMASNRSDDQPQEGEARQPDNGAPIRRESANTAADSDDNAAATKPAEKRPRSSGEADQQIPKQASRPADDSKDELRARVMSTELDDDDVAMAQLSEDNLRAVRDMDSSLELEQRRRSGGKKMALLGSCGIVVVLAGSLVFFWLRMPELSQDPRFRPWYQNVCDLAGCRLSPYVNPSQVITDNLVVRSHPQLADTLELTAVFHNQAEFPQPFPLIELRFADPDNTTILERELSPDEYLPLALRGMPLMPVGAPVQITLELEDPGPEAVNYRLDFKAAPPRPGS